MLYRVVGSEQYDGVAFAYGSTILTVVLGAPNLCGRCNKSAEVSR